MPHVDIRVNPKISESGVIERLVENMPTIVAEALSTELGTEGSLTAEEIDVTVQSYGSRDIYHHDIGIMIIANDYPARSQNLKERAQTINDRVEKFLENAKLALHIQMEERQTIKCYVWVLLAKGEFKEFTRLLIDNELP